MPVDDYSVAEESLTASDLSCNLGDRYLFFGKYLLISSDFDNQTQHDRRVVTERSQTSCQL